LLSLSLSVFLRRLAALVEALVLENERDQQSHQSADKQRASKYDDEAKTAIN
jgi:hypothetical protein